MLCTLLLLVAGAAEPVVLDERTVLHAAIHHGDRAFDYEAQARIELQADSRAWEALDREARDQAVAARGRELAAAVAAIDDATIWQLGDFVRVRSFDPASRTLLVVPQLAELHPLGWLAPRDGSQLAPGYALLVTNHAVQRKLTVPEAVMAELGLRLERSRRVFVELDLQLTGLLPGTAFATSIRAQRAYLDGPGGAPVATWRNPRPAADDLAASLLREGLTLDVVPNHHLQLPGGRLLDPLESAVSGRTCEVAGRLGPHLAVRCTLDAVYLAALLTRLEQLFVGGRLVEAAFSAREVPIGRRLATFERFLAEALHRPADATSWRSASGWRVRFAPERLADPASLAGGPVLVVTAEVPGLVVDGARIDGRADGPGDGPGGTP